MGAIRAIRGTITNERETATDRRPALRFIGLEVSIFWTAVAVFLGHGVLQPPAPGGVRAAGQTQRRTGGQANGDADEGCGHCMGRTPEAAGRKPTHTAPFLLR